MIEPRGPVLILGGHSDIGRAIAVAYAKAGLSIILAGRKIERLQLDAADIALRTGASARAEECDVLSVDPVKFFDALSEMPGTVVSVVGLLGEQHRAETDPAHARLIVETNFLGPALLLGEAAERLSRGSGGTIIGVSSVAGDRGRGSNYVYGSAKSGLTAFLSGLRQRFAGGPVRVITVKPGFVATRMTAGMKLPKRLTAMPEEVAQSVWGAHRKGRDVVYLRGIWRWIMLIIVHLPESIFKRTKL